MILAMFSFHSEMKESYTSTFEMLNNNMMISSWLNEDYTVYWFKTTKKNTHYIVYICICIIIVSIMYKLLQE